MQLQQYASPINIHAVPLVAGRKRSCPLIRYWPGHSAVHRHRLVLQRNLFLLVAAAARSSSLQGTCACHSILPYWGTGLCSRAVEGLSRYQGAFIEFCLILDFKISDLISPFWLFYRLRHRPRRYFSSVLGLVSPSPPMAEAVADGINSELNDRVTHIVTAHNTVHDKDVEND